VLAALSRARVAEVRHSQRRRFKPRPVLVRGEEGRAALAPRADGLQLSRRPRGPRRVPAPVDGLLRQHGPPAREARARMDLVAGRTKKL